MKEPKISKQEIEWVAQAQKGNVPAFNKLFNKYKSFVDHILVKYIKDMDEAKDITNIVFLKVYKNISQFTAYDSFGGWLRMIANRTAIDYLRKMEKRRITLGDSADRLPAEDMYVHGEDDIVNRLTYERILKEFEKLPEVHRRVCNLFYIDNCQTHEISETLSIPLGTVKSILSRTRKRIKQQLNT